MSRQVKYAKIKDSPIAAVESNAKKETSAKERVKRESLFDRLITKGKEFFSEEDLEVDKALIPEIWYDLNGKHHRYFPDIYIKTENKIIEVKSVYTYRIDKDILDVKKKAVREQGNGYEIWIIENKTIKEIL